MVVGGLVILSQVIPHENYTSAELLSSIMLFFIGGVGISFAVSIGHRYGDLIRYAIGVDQLRHQLLKAHHIPLPKMYRGFKESEVELYKPPKNFIYWFSAAGSYHIYIVFLNSIAIAIAIGVVMNTQLPSYNNLVLDILVSFLLFIVAILIQFYYGRRSRDYRVKHFNLLTNVNHINLG